MKSISKREKILAVCLVVFLGSTGFFYLGYTYATSNVVLTPDNVVLLDSNGNLVITGNTTSGRFFWSNGTELTNAMFNSWALSNLTDVSIISPVNGANLIYNSTLGVWENGPAQSFGAAVDCVNGTWIKHNLAGTPTAITVTIKAGYKNTTCSYITPTVIAENASHFQIGFYVRMQPIDRLNSIVPKAEGWATAPTNLANCVDNNWDTVTGTGENSVAMGIVGNLTWDMGASYSVELRSKVGLWSAVDSLNIKWYWSSDNITYHPTSELASSQIASTTEVIAFSQIGFVYARYIRLVTDHLTGGGSCNAKFYECQAWDLTNAVLPVGSSDSATVYWTASYVA